MESLLWSSVHEMCFAWKKLIRQENERLDDVFNPRTEVIYRKYSFGSFIEEKRLLPIRSHTSGKAAVQVCVSGD